MRHFRLVNQNPRLVTTFKRFSSGSGSERIQHDARDAQIGSLLTATGDGVRNERCLARLPYQRLSPSERKDKP
jgi:hypothetical protein